MEFEIWNILIDSKIENDTNYAFWIYKTENIIVENRRYLKIYLFNRYNTNQKLNNITVLYKEKFYKINEFAIVSKFNSNKIIGCLIQVDISDNENDVTIYEEVIDGNKVLNSNRTILYSNPCIGYDINYLLKEKINVFPYFSENFWQCSCGTINNGDKKCCLNCNKHLMDLNSYFTFEFLKNFKPIINIKNELTVNYKSNLDKISKKTSIPYSIIANTITIDYFEKIFEKSKKNIILKTNKKKRLCYKILFVLITLILSFVILFFQFKKHILLGYSKLVLSIDESITTCKIFESVNTSGENVEFEEKCNLLVLQTDFKNKEYLKIANLDEFQKFPVFQDENRFFMGQKILNLAKYELFNSLIADKKIELAISTYNDIDYSYFKEKSEAEFESLANEKILNVLETDVENGSYEFTQLLYSLSKKHPEISSFYDLSLLSMHNEISYYGKYYERAASLDNEYLNEYFGSITDFYKELKKSKYTDKTSDQCYDYIKIRGNWSNGSYYFRMNEDSYISYNLPYFEYGDYYSIYEGYIYLYKEIVNEDGSLEESDKRNLFKIDFISDDIAQFYCFKNGSTYTLYKN